MSKIIPAKKVVRGIVYNNGKFPVAALGLATAIISGAGLLTLSLSVNSPTTTTTADKGDTIIGGGSEGPQTNIGENSGSVIINQIPPNADKEKAFLNQANTARLEALDAQANADSAGPFATVALDYAKALAAQDKAKEAMKREAYEDAMNFWEESKDGFERAAQFAANVSLKTDGSLHVSVLFNTNENATLSKAKQKQQSEYRAIAIARRIADKELWEVAPGDANNLPAKLVAVDPLPDGSVSLTWKIGPAGP